MFISVNVYSGYIHEYLVKNLADSIQQHVRRTVDLYRLENHTIKFFAADQGIITQSQHHVFVPEVQEYLNKEKIVLQLDR